MKLCHKCKKEVDLDVAIGRLEPCPHCDAYLHCCLNCDFYDTGAQNECREPMAAYVRDRVEGNFCTYWRFKDTKPVDLVSAQAARLGLKALFGGEGPKEDTRDQKDKLASLFKKPPAPADAEPQRASDPLDAKAKLDALFKKKST
ncbi:MAG: hypothetical protein HYY84_11595 [Deltaproteobacteria bacterium]|nr:hypothetical protein [Deltaproteobacteria bacterium]